MVRGAPPVPLPALARHDGALTWHVPAGWWALSAAAVGGGLVRPRWVLNAAVDAGFSRTDLDAWARETAEVLGLSGDGCALLTAADVAQVEHTERDGAVVWATVGVTRPTWPHDPRAGTLVAPGAEASAPGATAYPSDGPPRPGTVNIVVALPVPLTGSALVQALATVTEAKAQVLVQRGVPGTGTASDAVVVLAPEPAGTHDAVAFAGVRSEWGRCLAHAVHDAVSAGLDAHPWVPGEDPVW